MIVQVTKALAQTAQSLQSLLLEDVGIQLLQMSLLEQGWAQMDPEVPVHLSHPVICHGRFDMLTLRCVVVIALC